MFTWALEYVSLLLAISVHSVFAAIAVSIYVTVD